MHVVRHTKRSFLLSDLKQTATCLQILVEVSNIKFHENSTALLKSLHADVHGEVNRRFFASFIPTMAKTLGHWELSSEITNTEGVIISQKMLVCW
jgi:hypothetical protein